MSDDFIRTSTHRIRGAATGEQNVPVKPEQFDDWLARHDAEVAANTEVEWEPGRWWTVCAADGSLWCQTSNEQEARDSMRPGDRLFRQWVRTETELREEQR